MLISSGRGFFWAIEIQGSRKTTPKGRLRSKEEIGGLENSGKNSGEPSLKSRGGWYDFVAGDLKDRQNPALYQPKWWAGHPVVIFLIFSGTPCSGTVIFR